MKYQIRTVTKQDLDQLVDLCAAHAAYEQCAYQPEGKKEALEKALFAPNAELQSLVVEVGEKLVGYVTVIPQYSTWDAAYYLYLDTLFLYSEYRGHGIGKALIELVKQKAVELGCFEVQWQTPDFNERAIKFYRREGAASKEKLRFFLPVEKQP